MAVLTASIISDIISKYITFLSWGQFSLYLSRMFLISFFVSNDLGYIEMLEGVSIAPYILRYFSKRCSGVVPVVVGVSGEPVNGFIFLLEVLGWSPHN